MAISETRKRYLNKWRDKNRVTIRKQALACYYRSHERRKLKNRIRAAEQRKQAGCKPIAEYNAWRAAHKLSSAERTKRWRLAHPDKARALDFIHNTRRRGFDVRHLAKSVLDRIAFYGSKCFYCHGPFEVIDHCKPLSKGGTHLPCNLVPACRRCNSAKSDKWQNPIIWWTCRDYRVSRVTINPNQRPTPTCIRVKR